MEAKKVNMNITQSRLKMGKPVWILLLGCLIISCRSKNESKVSIQTKAPLKEISLKRQPSFLKIQNDNTLSFTSSDSLYLLDLTKNFLTVQKNDEEMEFNIKGEIKVEGNLGYNFIYLYKGAKKVSYKVKLEKEFDSLNFCFNNILFPPLLTDNNTLLGFVRAKKVFENRNPFKIAFLSINHKDSTVLLSKTMDYILPNLKADNYYTFPELVSFNDSVYFSMGISPSFYNLQSNKLYDFESPKYKSANGFDVKKSSNFNDISIYSNTNPSYTLAGKYKDYFVFEYKAPLPMSDSILSQDKVSSLLFMKSAKEHFELPLPKEFVLNSVKIFNNQLYYATYSKQNNRLSIYSADIVAK